mgnify:CR=1 FL=1
MVDAALATESVKVNVSEIAWVVDAAWVVVSVSVNVSEIS